MSVANDLETTLKKLPELMKKREEELDKREEELEKAEARLKEKYPNFGKESDVVHLNVGGSPISVLRRTLIQVDGSLLASMFSGRWDDNLEKDEEGRFFIDQDVEIFQPLVSFLRELGSQTANTKPPHAPKFQAAGEENKFRTMLEYFGIALGVYRFACYSNVEKGNGVYETKEHSCFPNIEIQSDEKASFWLAPTSSSHQRYVKSFEVTMGAYSTVQIGWVNNGHLSNLRNNDSSGNKGVGYTGTSSAFDSSRSGMAVKGSYVATSGISIKQGTVIRCDGETWTFDGETKVSTSSKPVSGTVQVSSIAAPSIHFRPCITIKGSCRVTDIVLD